MTYDFAGDSLQIYLAPDGNDAHDGLTPEPGANGVGPLATLPAALRLLQQIKAAAQLPRAVEVIMRGGRYPIAKPIVINPELSLPVSVVAAPGETPIIDGGVRIEGWQPTVVNGVEAWVTELPAVAAGRWHFRCLYVNGERRQRPRLPKQDLYRLTAVPGMPLPASWGPGGYTRFKLGDGEMQTFRNLQDIEVILFHFWICERLPVAAFNAETGLITSQLPSRAPLTEANGEKLAPCYLENVFEALTEPGEWYLSREDGKLYYLPLPGEHLEDTEVFAPRVLQFLVMDGRPEQGKFIDWVRFQGIHFEHSDWRQPGQDGAPMDPAFADPARSVAGSGRRGAASAAQADADLPAVISLRGARDCRFEDCRVANTGWYGFNIGDGCQRNAVVGCEMFDLGGGGVKLNGAAFGDRAPALENGHNLISDCRIHQGGRVFCASVGILAMHTYCNRFVHNEISQLFYTGISVGWQWNFKANLTRDNIVAFNHIHHLGQGMLSDMGGVYTLGVQPGTVIRNNHIHDVYKLNYGAWCIYPDEGSSHILIENNVCHTTNGDIFHQHYGRDNIVRNNIFAFAEQAVVRYSQWIRPYCGFRLYRNLLLANGEAIYASGYSTPLHARGHESDLNLIYDYAGGEPRFVSQREADAALTMAAWREVGHDRHSVVQDPGCTDAAGLDFSLAADSPAARTIGFEPIDLSGVGPRPRGQRESWDRPQDHWQIGN